MSKQNSASTRSGLCLMLWCALAPWPASSLAEVTFDGSIGPNAAGTTRSGNFQITEADGQLSGNNLFQSFSAFNVNVGETATFSHSTAGVENIISRVSGNSATLIQGGVQVGQDGGGGLTPTAATLWLMNPNGILIGDGAAFDPNSSFHLSSGNRIGFANGDQFFSHEVTQNSTLSVAAPQSFGFLDLEPLPGSVDPGGIFIGISDAGNLNAPLFLADMVLVGSSDDAAQAGLQILGDLAPGFDQNSLLAPIDSSQIQAFELQMHALGSGGSVDLSAPNPVVSDSGSAIAISNANILVTDNAIPRPSSLTISGSDLLVGDSFIETVGLAGAADFRADLISTLQVSGSALKTLALGTANAGDLTLSANGVQITGSQLASIGPNLPDINGATDAGNIRITAGSAGMQLSDTSLINQSNAVGGTSGDIELDSLGDLALLTTTGTQNLQTGTEGNADSGAIRLSAAGTLNLTGSFNLISNTGTDGNAGDISLTAANINLSGDATAANGGIELSSSTLGGGDAGLISLTASDTLSASNVSAFSISGDTGAAGDIALQGGSVTLDSVSLFTSTIGTDATAAPGGVQVSAGESMSISNSTIQSNTGAQAPAGQVLIESEGDLTVSQSSLQSGSTADGSAGDITLRASDALVLDGDATLLLTNSSGSSQAGDITLQGGQIAIINGAIIQTAAEGSGDAGTIQLNADQISARSGRIESGSLNAGGGDILLYADDIRLDGNADTGEIVLLFADSQASDPNGNGGSITLGDPANPAEIIVVRSSGLTASADQGNGGRININSDAFIRDTGSLFLVTSVSGEPGALEINAPEQDISAAVTELDVALLDAVDLLENVCDRDATQRSSLILSPEGPDRQAPDQYQQTPPSPAGDGGNSDSQSYRGPSAAPTLACAEVVHD